eukprot:Lithocolla_globosa_v1_NODE_46_length_7973_cov_21.867264.p4 type:complete len:195 gc:universal NODE_46_length_7973_cov_21.867264:4153-3569(-)
MCDSPPSRGSYFPRNYRCVPRRSSCDIRQCHHGHSRLQSSSSLVLLALLSLRLPFFGFLLLFLFLFSLLFPLCFPSLRHSRVRSSFSPILCRFVLPSFSHSVFALLFVFRFPVFSPAGSLAFLLPCLLLSVFPLLCSFSRFSHCHFHYLMFHFLCPIVVVSFSLLHYFLPSRCLCLLLFSNFSLALDFSSFLCH